MKILCRWLCSVHSLSRSGFSLIEIVAVIAVASILSLLVAPSVISMLNANGLTIGIRDLSNHLVKARSEAIAKHTMTRFVVAKTWPEGENEGCCRYSIWRWNPENSEFNQVSPWGILPKGIVFEPKLPGYILKSSYAENDATSVLGDDAMSQPDAPMELQALQGKKVKTQFVEFLPNGTARIPEGTLSKVIFVIVEGEVQQSGDSLKIVHRVADGKSPKNWAQVNLDTLTGRVRIYRP